MDRYLGVKEEMKMRKSTVKKTAAKAPVAKEEAVQAESTVSVKAETAEPAKKEETKAIVKQEPGVVAPVEKKETAVVAVEKKAPAKKETKAAKEEKPAAKKAPAKKAAAEKTAAAEKKPAAEKKAPARRAAKAAEPAAEVEIQFSGKEYTTEKLVAIAKDVWQYDLGGKPEEFKTVKLYVKPEENAVYYVINGETTGSFAI